MRRLAPLGMTVGVLCVMTEGRRWARGFKPHEPGGAIVWLKPRPTICNLQFADYNFLACPCF